MLGNVTFRIHKRQGYQTKVVTFKSNLDHASIFDGDKEHIASWLISMNSHEGPMFIAVCLKSSLVTKLYFF